MYLLYETEQDAWDRSEEEGIYRGLAYHTQGEGSRYVTAPRRTEDGYWALDVDGYDLDDIESNTTVDSVIVRNYDEEID